MSRVVDVTVAIARVASEPDPGDVAILSPDERERASRYRLPHDAALFVTARAVARRLVAAFTGRSPNMVSFALDRYGKPQPHDAPGLGVSISHAGRLAAVAVAQGACVGIDVEPVARERRVVESVVPLLAPAEQRALEALTGDARAERFLRIWTRKEAVLKVLGTGLQTDLASFAVPSSLRLEQDAQVCVDSIPIYVRDLDTAQRYAASLAASSPIRSVRVVPAVDPR